MVRSMSIPARVVVPRLPAHTVSMYTDPWRRSDRTIMLPESMRNVRTEKLSAERGEV